MYDKNLKRSYLNNYNELKAHTLSLVFNGPKLNLMIKYDDLKY